MVDCSKEKERIAENYSTEASLFSRKENEKLRRKHVALLM